MSMGITYEAMRTLASAKYVNQARYQWLKELHALVAQAAPATYENPLGHIPAHWSGVLIEMEQAFVKHKLENAEARLNEVMLQSMIKELGKEDGNDH